MSADGNSVKTHTSAAPRSPLELAKASLMELLEQKKREKAERQDELAKQLKSQISELRGLGVSLDVMSAHLKAAGIPITKKALAQAIKRKGRGASKSKTAVTAPLPDQVVV